MKRLAWGAVGALLVVGCGDRSEFWNAQTGRAQPFALADAVAIADPDANRVVLLTTGADRSVTQEVVPIQRGYRSAAVAPDRSQLFIVSAGDDGATPPAGKAAQTPALEIVTTSLASRRVYPLSDALGGVAMDPRGQWVVLYAGTTSSDLVSNPNELLLVDLTQPASPGLNPISHTLRSFGGKPVRFTFTDTLELPGGSRRLLVVETEQDVAVVDLLHPAAPEITIQLSSGTDATPAHPAGITISDGDPGPNDARIAIREDDRNVVIATMLPATDRDFSPELNLTDVGGIPSDAAWVRTDAGALALAALVPTAGNAVLVDPTTGLTQAVTLPTAYSQLSLVTAQTGEADSTAVAAPVDVALLWNGSNGGVAFWELGRVAGRPYRSVETVGVTSGVTSVMDVGGAHPELKILGTKTNMFFLLDLQARTASPFVTSTNVSLLASATGDRAWAYLQGSSQLATIDLQTLHPQGMRAELPIASLFEIAAAGGAGRSLVALDQQGTWAATVYDAAAVDDADDHTTVSGILLEGSDATP